MNSTGAIRGLCQDPLEKQPHPDRVGNGWPSPRFEHEDHEGNEDHEVESTNFVSKGSDPVP